MSHPRATETGHGVSTTGVSGSRTDRQRLVVPMDRLMYLQALFPYASFQQLQSIIADTCSTDEAACLGYDALNPDYTGLPYLRQQWKLKHDSDAPSTERKNAFQGISEALLDRAGDVFPSGQLANASSVREYDSTMQLFPIDTSDWDVAHLHTPKSAGEYANDMLPLTNADLYSPFTKPQSSPLLPQQQRQLSFNGSEGSFGASGLEMASQGVLPAPIVRWAPRAMRVSTHLAKEAQEELFRIFDDAAFFSAPLLPFDLSDAGRPPTSTLSHGSPASTSPQDAPEGGPEAQRHKAFTARSLESHEPLDADAGATALPSFGRPSSFAGYEDPILESTATARVMGPRSRASALVALEEQKSRGSVGTTSLDVQRRMQKLKPLDNTVFQQPDAAVAERPQSPLGPAHGAADPRSPPVAAAAGDRRFDMMPAVGYATESRVKAMSTSAFLEREVQQWDETVSTLRPYEGVFDYKNRCELVVQLHKQCPLFVDRLELLITRLLPVFAAELMGKRLSEGLHEMPMELPVFGCKLVSTGEIRLHSLVFDVEKCKAAFQDEGSRVRIKVHIKEFSLEPLAFAYIDEATAARERRKSTQHSTDAGKSKHSGPISASESLHYETGVTKGTMSLACTNTSIDVVGGAWLLSAGKVFVIVESAKVKLGSLKISSDVTKMNVLTSLAKPLLKSALKRQLQSTLEGSHPL